MHVYYVKDVLNHDTNLSMNRSLIGIEIKSVNNGIYRVPSINGQLPPLITFLSSRDAMMNINALSDCHYPVLIIRRAIFSHVNTHLGHCIRLKVLVLQSSFSRSVTTSHSHVRNTKQIVATIFPNSLLHLNINHNNITRIKIGSVINFESRFCFILNEAPYRESILHIKRYMAYYRKPRAKQKSIRHYELAIYARYKEGSWYDCIVIGRNGIYNEFLCLVSNRVIIK